MVSLLTRQTVMRVLSSVSLNKLHSAICTFQGKLHFQNVVASLLTPIKAVLIRNYEHYSFNLAEKEYRTKSCDRRSQSLIQDNKTLSALHIPRVGFWRVHPVSANRSSNGENGWNDCKTISPDNLRMINLP